MGKVRNCLLATFRVFQFLFSLIALGCAAYITYEMYQLGSLALDLQNFIAEFASEYDLVDDLAKLINPILVYLQETPTRAIVLTVVSFISVLIIIYFVIARRSKNHPGLDRQSIRISLELVILLAWFGGLACGALLAAQYGTIALSGGVAIKVAMKAVKALVKDKLGDLPDMDQIIKGLDMFDTLATIALMSVVCVVSAFICVTTSIVSFFVACCSRTKKQKDSEHAMPAMTAAAQPLNSEWEEKPPRTTYKEKIARKPIGGRGQRESSAYIAEANAPWQQSLGYSSHPPQSYQSPSQQSFSSPQSYQSPTSVQSWGGPPQGWQQSSAPKWHAPEHPVTPPMPYTPPTPYTGKPTPYMALTSSQSDQYSYADHNRYYSRVASGADQWGR